MGDLEILEFLCNSGADVNTTNRYLSTPLHIAARYDKLEIAKFLLDRGANVNATDYKDLTPLYLASNHCHLDMVKLLLCKGADASIQSQHGKTALDVVGNARKDECSSSEIQKIESILSSANEADCEAKLTPIKAGIKDANDSTDSVSSEASLSLSPTKAIKIELEVSNTKDLASSTVNSSFTLIRENFEEVSSTASNAVRPSSFINSVFSWMGTSTTAALSSLFQSAPALPPPKQSIAHSTGSSIGSSQVDCNGTVLLTAIAISKFTGERYSMPLDDSLLTIRQVKERKLNSLERDVKMALSKCDKLYQYPESSLSNFTISKGVRHQKAL
ncbi:ankyrin repeat domain-containing protein [Wolbachia endosymbiont of Encarsia formosa]|uniref:ankyrin repeat domain-containing protein n=1 Tax=Wolbachia endosymbiont of Encarsia formosa TaxID=77125 RepID=UPI0031BB4731